MKINLKAIVYFFLGVSCLAATLAIINFTYTGVNPEQTELLYALALGFAFLLVFYALVVEGNPLSVASSSTIRVKSPKSTSSRHYEHIEKMEALAIERQKLRNEKSRDFFKDFASTPLWSTTETTPKSATKPPTEEKK